MACFIITDSILGTPNFFTKLLLRKVFVLAHFFYAFTYCQGVHLLSYKRLPHKNLVVNKKSQCDKITLDNYHNVGYNNRIAIKEEANKMNKDSFTMMVKDGKDLIQIIQSMPEDKRPMFSAIAGAYIDGMIAQERLAAAERPGA